MKACACLGGAALGLAVSFALPATPAQAQDGASATVADDGPQRGSIRRSRTLVHEAPPADDTEDLTVEGGIALVSDYRSGGLSSSLERPAAQGWVTLSHRSGFYASAWTSTLGGEAGGTVELQFAGGYAFTSGAFDIDVGFVEYVFPKAETADYVEAQGSVSHRLGPALATLAFAYTPPQEASDKRDNVYAGVEFELPLRGTPVTLAGLAGVEDGAFGDAKLDWSLGATVALEPFDIGVTYVGSARTGNEPYAGDTLVLALAARL